MFSKNSPWSVVYPDGKISLSSLVSIKTYARDLLGISEMAPQRPVFESLGSVTQHKMLYYADSHRLVSFPLQDLIPWEYIHHGPRFILRLCCHYVFPKRLDPELFSIIQKVMK